MTAILHRVFGRLRARSRAGAGAEHGFTLIEVVASVVILGIIAAPLGMAMVLGFRTAFSQQENISRTTDVQQLSSYFPSDVQSVDAQGVNPTDANNSAICREDSTADQTSLITFVWNEDQGISGQSMARYIAEGSGTSSKIVRRFCRGAADPSQPASATNDWTDITVASHFGTDSGERADLYTVTTDPNAPVQGGTTPQCTASSCFIEIHGAYDYRLDANRRVPGQSPNSRPPDVPINVHGVPGNQRVTLYWTDGANNGSALTSYTIETTPGTSVVYPTGPANLITGSTGVQINGLTNATSYKFRVKATNSAGSSAFSAYSDVIVPGPTTPDPPTIGTATASPTVNGSADVAWTLPTGYNNGGANLVGFRLYALNSPDAPVTADVNSPTATTGTVTGLKDNTSYTLQVAARNVYGEGSPSAASNAVLTLPGKPGTPNVQSTGTAGSVVLTFSPPSDGDFANFTNFRAQVTGRASAETAVPTATACPNGSSGTCSLTVTGLGTSGQTYSIAVQAQNATGWGALSDPATGIELTPPTISGAAIMPVGAPGGGYIGPNVSYNVYANATDASGVATVSANVNNVTPGQTAASLSTAGGPWTVGSTSYTYRTTTPLTAGSSLTAGTKSYSITAIDTFANSATSSFNVTGDVTAPTVTLTKVSGSTPTFPYSTNAASIVSVGGACGSASSPPDNPVVNITVTGPSSPSGTATCTSGSWTYTFASPITAEGSYSFTATQSDDAGNTGSSGTKVVNLDRSGPTVTSIISSSTDTTTGGYIKQGGQFYVYANATDALSGVTSVSSTLPTTFMASSTTAPLSTTGGPWTVGGTSYAYRSAAQTAKATVTAGSYTYTVVGTDGATNTTTITPSVTVDNTGPSVSSVIASSSTTTTAGYIRQGGQFYVYGNASDATSGVSSVTSTLPTTFMASSTTAPLTTAGGPWTVGGTSYAYRSAIQTAKATITATAYTYTVVATDGAANTTTITPSVTVDNTAPAPTVTSVNGAVRSFTYSTNVDVTSVGGACGNAAPDLAPLTVTISGVDDETGAATCSAGAWSYTLATPWSAEGSSTVSVSQDDAAGNTGNSTSRTVIIDKTIPVVTLTSPTSGTLTKDTTPTFSGACTSGQGNVLVTITGPTNTTASGSCSGSSWSATPSTLAQGGYSAVATQTDAAGNTGTSSSVTFTVDTTAPSVSSVIASSTTTAIAGYIRQGGQFYVYANASDALSGVSSVSSTLPTTFMASSTTAPLSTTGGPWTVGGTSYAYRSVIQTAKTTITAASYTYTVVATDGATNTTTITPSVTVDNTAPAPTVTKVNNLAVGFPYTTNSAGGVTSVGGGCSNGATDFASVDVTISGDYTLNATANCTAGAWTLTLNPTWNADGNISVAVTQSDAAGNTGAGTTRVVTLDRAAPTISASVMASTTDTSIGGYVRASGTYYVYANVSDDLSTISTVTANASSITTSGATSVTLSSGAWTIGGTSYNYRSASLTATSSISAGTKSYSVTATDAPGNSTGAQSFNVTVDNTKPTPTNVTLNNAGTPGTVAPGDYVVLTYSGPLDPDTLCTTWSGPGDQSATATVTISTSRVLSITTTACNKIGTVNTTGTYVTSSTRTFSNSTIAWDESAHTITITLGSASGGNTASNVSAAVPTYTPTTSILDPAGNSMNATTVNGTSSRF